jgi:hypothetical protein
MIFGKKKELIDIRDLPRNTSMGKSFIPKDGYGFVDLTQKRKLPSEIAKEKALLKSIPQTQSTGSTSSFSFFDTPTPTSTSSSNYPSFSSTPASSSSSDTEDMLRKISSQISDLDTKIYKMEQRIELLEKKAGVSNSGSSAFSW